MWEDGYFARTVGDKVTAEVIRQYIRRHKEEPDPQLKLFRCSGFESPAACGGVIYWIQACRETCCYDSNAARYGNTQWPGSCRVVARYAGKTAGLFEQRNRFAIAPAYRLYTPLNTVSERGRVKRVLPYHFWLRPFGLLWRVRNTNTFAIHFIVRRSSQWGALGP